MYRLLLIFLAVLFLKLNILSQADYKIKYWTKNNAILDLKEHYENEYKKDTNNLVILKELALNEYKIKDFESCTKHFNKILQNKKYITEELLLLNGKSHKILKNFFKAKEQFKLGLSLAKQTKNRDYINQFNREIESLNWAIINDTVYFDYNKTKINQIKNDNALHNSNWYNNYLFINNFIINTDSISAELYNPIENVNVVLKNNLKNKKIGNFSHFKENKIFFSICDSNNICKIGIGEINNDSINKIRIVKGLNYKENITYTMPFHFFENKKSYLLFCSNNKTSRGGLDIYYGELINEDSVGSENNLSNINTPSDDISPFYDHENQILYFSNSWMDGYGGLDIFKTTFKNHRTTTINNLGKPINSSYNDLNFNIKDSIITLTSNRLENNHCCNKYFHFTKKSIQIDSVLYIENSKKNQDTTIFTKNNSNINKNLESLFPIKLYFHNDIPNPKTLDTITEIEYNKTYFEYLELKNEYITQNKNLKNNEINSFFNSEISKGYLDLNTLLENIKLKIEDHWKFKIYIKGFASPLASNSYNLKLSKRRISSIINYIKKYDHGIFSDKIGTEIIIEIIPFGEEKADKKVSDNPKNKMKSIYSIDAARERKIELIGIEVIK